MTTMEELEAKMQQVLDEIAVVHTTLSNKPDTTTLQAVGTQVDNTLAGVTALQTVSQAVDGLDKPMQDVVIASTALIGALQQLAAAQGQLNTILTQPFVCNGSKMKVTVSCDGIDCSAGAHEDYKVTYSGLGIINGD